MRVRLPILVPGLVVATAVLAAGKAAPAEDTPLPSLETLLKRLGRVANLYRDQALGFTCDETINYTGPGKTEALQFRYIYRFSGPEKMLMDWREPRGRAAEQSRRKQEMARLDNYGLPTFVKRAYSWVFVFEEDKQPHFRYEIEGTDEMFYRPAIRVRFDAVPPYQDGVNEWCGAAWVDRESWQILYVEAVHECDAAARMRSRLSGESDAESLQQFDLTEVATDFDIVENGMRFPGRVVLRRTKYTVEAVNGTPLKREVPEFKITQIYKRYQFFGVRTHEEIRKMVEAP